MTTGSAKYIFDRIEFAIQLGITPHLVTYLPRTFL